MNFCDISFDIIYKANELEGTGGGLFILLILAITQSECMRNFGQHHNIVTRRGTVDYIVTRWVILS